jgi:hypothetical protein
LRYSPFPLPLQAPFFNNFRYMSLSPLPAQMLCFVILLTLCHSLFLSLFPWVPWSSSTSINTWVCIMIMLVSCMFIFWIYLLCMRENMWPLSFWACHFHSVPNTFYLFFWFLCWPMDVLEVCYLVLKCLSIFQSSFCVYLKSMCILLLGRVFFKPQLGHHSSFYSPPVFLSTAVIS